MEGKSNFWRSLEPERKHRTHQKKIHFAAVYVRLDGNLRPHLRHAEDPGVEIQGFNGVFDPQHGLLHHKILKHTMKASHPSGKQRQCEAITAKLTTFRLFKIITTANSC